mmetsp:Transcript_11781/g.18495  ORF Transcript_11781/g.18495 Transcript_11781/m.18495 type:complete len:334 (+) Transcript_11781:63-1064(+)
MGIEGPNGPLGPRRAGMRPELIILLLLIIAVPIIAWQAYRKVSFEFNEIMTALTSHPCTYISPVDRVEYDLTSLSKKRGSCSSSNPQGCQDYKVHRQDDDFYLNVCSNVMRKPAECVNLFGERNVQSSIGYQTADGVCYTMGSLRTGKWSLLDNRHPEAGLKLTYTGGDQCDGRTERSTEFHFECNPDAGDGEPVTVMGDCDFVVTWETALACPSGKTSLFQFLFWGLALFGLYLMGGFFHNVRFKNLPADIDAIPHIDQLRWFGSLVTALFQQLLEQMQEYIPATRGFVSWVQGTVGNGYEAISGSRSGAGSDSGDAKRTGGILDRQGHEQL